MKKEHLLFFFIVILLFLVGCEEKKTETGGRFIGGDKGLSITFIDEEPPDTVLDNSQEKFDITLLLENEGEYDIKEGDVVVTLKGISKEAFSLSSLSVKSEEEVNGKRKARDRVVVGDEIETKFKNAVFKDDLSADFDIDMRADVCYEYGTKAVTDLCVKKEPSKTRTGDQCKLDNDNIKVENSGAPIKVSLMSQVPRSDEVKFTFEIEKTGSGEVYEPDTFTSECDEQRDKKDRIKVKVTSSSKRLSIKCSKLNDGSEGIVDLYSNKRTISCRVGTSGLQSIAYEEPIDIELNYAYKDSKTKSITVENAD